MFKFNKIAYTILMFQWIFDGSKTNVAATVRSKLIEIPLTKIQNNYYGYIVVGTPVTAENNNQIFRVNFDTGSQHLWLMTTEVCSTPNCRSETFTPYDKSKSATYMMSEVKRSFTLAYTDGTRVTGLLGRDQIQLSLGGASLKFNQTIGFASEVKGNIKNCDGIFGLGLLSRSLVPGAPDPPMYTMSKLYDIDEFGIYLARVLEGDGAGKLVFGGHDESSIEGKLEIHKVVRVKGLFEGYMIKFDKIIVQKGKVRKEILTENMLALPDSGNNIIAGPKEMFDSINADIMGYTTFEYNFAKTPNMPGLSIFQFRCSEKLDELPNVIFVMDRREYVLYPKDYIWFLPKGELCRLGLVGMKTDHIVLGQIFMQTFYSKFNIMDATVGFARAKHRNN